MSNKTITFDIDKLLLLTKNTLMTKLITALTIALFMVSFNPIDPKKESSLALTKENLLNVMRDMDIRHIDIVFAQAMLESGALKSKMCREKNNLFGMKVATRRETTATNKKGYASYSHWIESVKDYKLYQDYVTKKKDCSRSEYLFIIAKGYSETPDYVARLNNVIKKNKFILN